MNLVTVRQTANSSRFSSIESCECLVVDVSSVITALSGVDRLPLFVAERDPSSFPSGPGVPTIKVSSKAMHSRSFRLSLHCNPSREVQAVYTYVQDQANSSDQAVIPGFLSTHSPFSPSSLTRAQSALSSQLSRGLATVGRG